MRGQLKDDLLFIVLALLWLCFWAIAGWLRDKRRRRK